MIRLLYFNRERHSVRFHSSLRPMWHDHCGDGSRSRSLGEYSSMKSLGSSIAQFAAIIIIMIALAMSTAAFSMWLGDGANSHGAGAGAQPLWATASP